MHLPSAFLCFTFFKTLNFSAIHLNQKAVIHKNIHNLKALDKQHEITAMTWGNQDESEVGFMLDFL